MLKLSKLQKFILLNPTKCFTKLFTYENRDYRTGFVGMFEFTSSKKIAVVTGGAGFLGSHLSDRLIAEGFRVIALDNLVTGSSDNIGHLAGNLDFKLVRHNVSESVFIPGPVDYVFHFASPASPIDYLELPIPTLKVGALGTHNALGLAKEKNAVFVLASTSECYGDPLVHPLQERKAATLLN